jgi:beta-glucosidase
MVMSDWTGTNSVAESIKAGCDLEMPGPAQWRGLRALKAINQGELPKSDIKKAAYNVLKLVSRTKGLHGPAEPPEQSIDNPNTSSLIREAAAQGLTLLKNEHNILPIKNARTIAVIGPNVKRAVVGGGGSATLNPYYTISPFEGIQAATDAELLFAQGCDSTKWLPLASDHCETEDGRQGVTLKYYHGDKFEGEPVSVQHKQTTDLFLWDSAPKAVLPAYSFEVKTLLTPRTSGNHVFSFSSVGPGKFYIGGELFIDNWDWAEEGEAMFEASQDVHKSIYLEAGKTVELSVQSTNEIRPASKLSTPGSQTHRYGGCRIGYQEESKVNLLQEAISAAKAADVVLVIVGLDAEWESEGYDRQSMDLPKHGNSDRLIEAVLDVNSNTIVVNQSGTPVSMPWAERVPAILQAWYQGQEAGHALADVIFGKHNPGGKLPTTFPKRLEDNPTFTSWPGDLSDSVYTEGLFVGYRHYEARHIAPLFPFGHGLSYTTFLYGEPSISAVELLGEKDHDTLVVRVSVTNTGDVAGHEVVQAYVRDEESRLPRPEKELKAFVKLFIQPGETRDAELVLDKYSAGYYDDSLQSWVAEHGRFQVLIGASSVDIR